MHVFFHKHFDKRFSKLPYKVQLKAMERIQLFRTDPLARVLNNHALGGKYSSSRSIDVTGNYRALYESLGDDGALFVDIGTHSQLYD